MKYNLGLATFLAVASLFATTPTYAQIERPLGNGNQLLAGCRGENGPAEQLACSFYIDGIVGGYMLAVGLHETNSAICVPDDVTGGQISDVVIHFLEAHPEIRHESSRVLIAMAVMEAFPCST